MQAVLIDQFVVPETAIEEFLRQVHYSASIIRTRPGFVEGHVFRRTAGDGRVAFASDDLGLARGLAALKRSLGKQLNGPHTE